MFEDLSYRYPVAPLAGARSARAELAIAGHWQDWPVIAASVLVQPAVHVSSGRTRDIVVQLTILDLGPDVRQFAATWSLVAPRVVMLTQAGDGELGLIEDVLEDAGARGDLLPDDRVALGEVELLHTRVLRSDQCDIDVEGPLRLLARLAAALS